MEQCLTQDGHSVRSVSCLFFLTPPFFLLSWFTKVMLGLSGITTVSLCRPVTEGQSSSNSLPTSIMVSLPAAPPPPPPPVAPSPARPNNSLSNRKPGILPANLEEMKVPKPYILTLDSKVIALTFLLIAGKMFCLFQQHICKFQSR